MTDNTTTEIEPCLMPGCGGGMMVLAVMADTASRLRCEKCGAGEYFADWNRDMAIAKHNAAARHIRALVEALEGLRDAADGKVAGAQIPHLIFKANRALAPFKERV